MSVVLHRLFPFYEDSLPIGSLLPPQNITLPSRLGLASGPTIPETCASLLTPYVSTNLVGALSLQHPPVQSAQRES